MRPSISLSLLVGLVLGASTTLLCSAAAPRAQRALRKAQQHQDVVEDDAPAHSPLHSVRDRAQTTELITLGAHVGTRRSVELADMGAAAPAAGAAADRAWANLRDQLGDKGDLVIRNVPDKHANMHTLTLHCEKSTWNGKDSWTCEDPCTIGITFNNHESTVGGVTARWAYIDSILYSRSLGLCEKSMPLHKVKFRGVDMVEAAIHAYEQAGFRHGYLVDGSHFPCGGFKSNNRGLLIGMLDSGSSYYMRFGFFPVKKRSDGSEDIPMSTSQAEWCSARRVFKQLTVGQVLEPTCVNERLCAGFCHADANPDFLPEDANPPLRLARSMESAAEQLRTEAPELLDRNIDNMRVHELVHELKSRIKMKGPAENKLCQLLRDVEVLAAASEPTTINQATEALERLERHHASDLATCPHLSSRANLPIIATVHWARFSDGFPDANGNTVMPDADHAGEYCPDVECETNDDCPGRKRKCHRGKCCGKKGFPASVAEECCSNDLSGISGECR